MPSSRVHVLAGAALFVVLYSIILRVTINDPLSWVSHVFLFGLTLTGSIFPDIDIKSNMQNTFYKCMLFVLPVALYANQRMFFALLAMCVALKILKHRGITHNPFFLIAAPAAACAICVYRAPAYSTLFVASCICFAAGALSHVILDRTRTYFLYKK